MLERPALADESLIAALNASYRLQAQSLDFLPIGNDARAWSYRVETASGEFFLKLRKGRVNRAALLVPHHLRRCGIEQVVAPLPAINRQLHARLGDYALTLYPYIPGESDWDMALSPAQWRQWGAVMRSIHRAPIPPELATEVPREIFGVKWLDQLQRVEDVLARSHHQGEPARAVAEIWRQNQNQIRLCRRRYLSLGARMKGRSPAFTLCHADIHSANIILDAAGLIHIVDWDECLLAPKERDLMFFIDDGRSALTTEAFFAGYGDTAVDPLGLAYYKYDWALQEFADYGARVFLSSALSDRELALSRREFARLFQPNDVIARAHRAFDRLVEGEA